MSQKITVTPQGIIYLCKTPLINDYKNQLTFSNETTQYNYFASTIQKSFSDYYYIKKDNTVKLNVNIDDIINCNYLFYRNAGFTNKLYYCFITNMEYINENCTAVTFETDVYQTWLFNINYNKCFIEREHVNNDAVGLHTVPENLETGEYFCNDHAKDATMDSYASDLCFIMASTSQPLTGEAKDTVAPTSTYNGIYTGLSYYRYDATSAIDSILEIFAKNGKTDAINGIFMAPKWLAPLSDGVLRDVAQSSSPNSFNINLVKQAYLDGYLPRNNKLRCFPYNFLLVSNNIGQNGILHYEKFSGDVATFNVKGVLNPGCSINITPTNYNGSASSDNDAIQLGKFPICNFQNDMYTNWLTQNSINVMGQTISSDDINIASNTFNAVSGIASNVTTGNYSGSISSTVNGLSSIANSLIQQKQHNMISPTVNGQLNSADVNVASGNNTFHFYKMSIKKEYAKIIDDYFSMYGYKVNEVKVPNINGRQNWNYVKTIECNFTGDIPQTDMLIIKQMFNNGTTLWHNPSTMYNYSNSNNIL